MGTDARMLAYTHRIAQACEQLAETQARRALVTEATYLRAVLTAEPGVSHASKRARLEQIEELLTQ